MMSGEYPMNYKGIHKKYIQGTSEYVTYHYGDVVKRGDNFYVCGVTFTSGYLPEDSVSGFTLMSFSADPSPNTQIDGGTY